jgi:hypothetical protein
MSQAPFSLFFIISLFYHQKLKSIIFNNLDSPGDTKNRLSGGLIMTRHVANSSSSKAKSPASKETGLF